VSVFATEQWVPAPLAEVFLFFAEPQNLLRVTPPSARAELTAIKLVPPPARPGIDLNGLAGVGTEITIALRPFAWLPLRQEWATRIVEFEWEHHFRDVHIRGPFRRFSHLHSFRAEEREGVSGTVVGDRIEARTGFGPPADAFARRQLARVFAYRQARLAELFPAR